MEVSKDLSPDHIKSSGGVIWGKDSIEQMLRILREMPLEIRLQTTRGETGKAVEITQIEMHTGMHPTGGIARRAECWVDLNYRQKEGSPVLIPHQISEEASPRETEDEFPKLVFLELGPTNTSVTIQYPADSRNWFTIHF